MRSKAEIRDRIQELLSKELDARIAMAHRRLPSMCEHNHRQALDVRKRVEDEPNELYNRLERGPRLPIAPTIGLCMLGSESPEDWPGNICEDPIDAQRCPWFSVRVNKETLIAEFQRQVADSAWLQEHMPEVYALSWVLNSQERLPWWKRAWYYLFASFKPEPLSPDPTS